jgi:ferredoxin-NADP reductase
MPGTEALRLPDARLARIVRYPVKGLPGVSDTEATVAPGRGLRHDRGLAIDRGAIPTRDAAGWNPRETYFHLAMTEQIALLGTKLRDPESDAAVLTITAGDGRSADLRLDAGGFAADHPAADALLGDVLPAGPLGAPALRRTGAQLWDWPAAQLSIINLATLRVLSESAGVAVDPRRFRGNLYLDGLDAWAEFALLGRRIRIGDAEFEVFQPTDRCRATTIDPVRAVSDLNVPALLAGRFGHMYCGVYARPVSPGAIRVGDALTVVDSAAPPIDRAATAWPRRGTVVETTTSGESVQSFWIEDAAGLAPAAVPGQHIRVHLPGEAAPAWRCYTISGVREGAFRVSVKRDGRISTALHDRFAPGESLVITGPFGDVTLAEAGSRDVVLLSAGVGITPTVAMLRALAGAAPGGRRVRVLHVDRDVASVPLWDEVVSSVAAVSGDLRLHLTRADDDELAFVGAIAGRPGADALSEILAGLDPDRVAVYACGPAEFTSGVRKELALNGVADENVHVEVFFSPTTAELAEPREPTTTGPHVIRVGDDEIEWRPESGSLLDAVEGIGIPWASGCRTGACGTCVRALRSGGVEYLTDPVSPPKAGTVLVCCAAPISDVELD